jgi:hypothetical protein
MNDLDQKIQAALQRDRAGANADEPNLAEEVISAFRGRHRWLTGVAVVFSFGLFGILVWAVFQFRAAEAVREQLIWGGVTLWTALAIGFIKVWFWLEMHSNRVLREVKRLELLLLTRADLPAGGRPAAR